MQRTVQYFICSLFTAVLMIGCGNGVSLQKYYVENQELKGFMTVDLPVSMMGIEQSDLSEEQQKAYNSVDKLNALLFRISETDMETYNEELAQVKSILSDEKYNDLMEVSDRGRKIIVKYVGTDEAADEVVVLGSSQDMGFAIVRLLGDDMNPEKMGLLINSLQNANIDENQVQDIMNFFK